MKLDLGKILFPHTHRELRRHKLRLIVTSAVVALVFAAVIVFIMFLADKPWRVTSLP